MKTELNKLPQLNHFQTIFINVEGLGQWAFEDPIQNRDKIFDRLVESSLSHKFLSVHRDFSKILGDTIHFTFVTDDDFYGVVWTDKEVEVIAKWLNILKQPTMDELIDEVMNERQISE